MYMTCVYIMKAVISEVKLQSNHVYLQENVDSINLILSQRKKVNYKRSIFFCDK